MKLTLKYTGKAKSVPAGLAVSSSASMVITLALTAVIASFLNKEIITWEQAGYWIMGMLFAASYLGSKCAYALIKRQRIFITILNGLLYWGILLSITALFFGGKYDAVLETAGIIGAGTGTAALVTLHIPQKQRKKHQRLLLS